jgi:hypothetical protein
LFDTEKHPSLQCHGIITTVKRFAV